MEDFTLDLPGNVTGMFSGARGFAAWALERFGAVGLFFEDVHGAFKELTHGEAWLALAGCGEEAVELMAEGLIGGEFVEGDLGGEGLLDLRGFALCGGWGWGGRVRFREREAWVGVRGVCGLSREGWALGRRRRPGARPV